MIGIIGAMDIEVENIKALLSDITTERVSGIDFVKGKFSQKDVVVAKCGVGKVFSALCTEAMILKYNPKVIINVGVAGCLTPELKIGDIVIADKVVQHDMDTSPLGDPIGMLSDINIVHIPTDKDVTALLEESVKSAGFDFRTGTIASGDQFIADKEKKDFIKSNFGAISCEMEGGSIGHVCYVNGVDFCVVRAISDSANGEASVDYPEFMKMAAENSIRVIKKFLAECE